MISSSALSARIWFLTSLIFGVGLFMASSFDDFYMNSISVLFLGFICALLGSIPVVISLVIVLPLIQDSAASWQRKFWKLLIFIKVVTLIYGILPAFLNRSGFNEQDDWTNNFFVTLFGASLILFAAAFVAVLLSLKRVYTYLSMQVTTDFSYPTFFHQLFYKPKNNINMDYDQTQQPDQSQQFEQSQQIQQPQQTTSSNSNSILIKGIITGVLILVMLVPTFFINSLINERETRQKEVVKEVSEKWATAQTLSAPYILVPYTYQTTDTDGKLENKKTNLILLSDKMEVKGEIIPEVRPRSIYKVLLYRSFLNFEGNFKTTWPADINMANIDFTNAKLCINLSDYKGIEEEVFVNYNNEKLLLSQAGVTNDLGVAGLSVPINVTAEQLKTNIPFSLQIKLKGSEQLHFLPLSSNSKFNISSKWQSPSFDGNTLPDDRTYNDSGFNAKWNFTKANLPFGTVIKEGVLKAGTTSFGVSLVQPGDQYSKSTRSVKYAILLIGLTFALFFIIELMQKKPLHPVQYVLVGLALVIFYTLLLSISEYILFDYAYLIAAAATILLITFYAKGHFNSWKSAGIFGALLTCLYGFIFILIRLEDAALLIGSIGLFLILALVMYGSRKINWYGSVVQNGESGASF
jgi:inner membrane protein